jgi:hypothetical protein
MKIYYLLISFSLLIACDNSKNDKKQIESVYTEYENAAKQKDIQKMIDLSSVETINYFDKIVENAKYLDSISVTKLAPIDKTLILYLRQTLTIEQLFIYTGKELLQFNLRNSLNVKSDEKVKLKKIEVNSETAQCSISINGKTSKVRLEFKKENNLWKYNFVNSFTKSTNDNFYISLQKLKISENDFLKRIVQNMSGKELSDKLWNQQISR